MTRQPLGFCLHKLINSSALAFTLLTVFAGCGGGYDGGAQFDAQPSEIPVPSSDIEPTLSPVPEPISKSQTPRQAEFLDRGIIAMPTSVGNVVSWRLLGTDDPQIVFDVYRNATKVTASPLATKTFYVDREGSAEDQYQVVAIVDGNEVSRSKTAAPWAKPYLGIPLSPPQNGVTPAGEVYTYLANDASTADLDGDGQYEIILKWVPSNAKDNAQDGYTGKTYFDAYTLQGKQLWRINLGINIRAGAHYDPFMAFDFDGDGRAELAVKTADGAVDGQGNVIGDAAADYRGTNGKILQGPEFLTMFDGLSGEALDTVSYNPPRGEYYWGDDSGNRVDRFLAAVAYLDGEVPSLLMARGIYTRVVISAYNWVDGAFQERWVFDTENGGNDAAAAAQGNHQLSIADVDGDGNDEIIYGAATIDNDGSLLYSTGLGHGDALHVGDLDPNRPGLEVYAVHESPLAYQTTDAQDRVISDHGVNLRDAATGEIIWSRPGNGDDIGRGVSIDIDPRYPGNESWATRQGMVAADGSQLVGGSETAAGGVNAAPSAINFAVWWDGDLLREMLDSTRVSKWNYVDNESFVILDASENYQAVANNGTKATPSLSADLFGDWREEIIWPKADQSELMVFSSPHDTDFRFLSLMHDSQYRLAIAWQNNAYNQPPHPSFYIGPDTVPVWQSDIETTEGSEWAKLVARSNSDYIELEVFINQFDVDSIIIKRSTDLNDAAPSVVATLANGERIWRDDAVQEDTTYYYWAEFTGSTATTQIALTPSRGQLDDGIEPILVAFAVSVSKKPFYAEVSWSSVAIEAEEVEIFRGANLNGSDRESIAVLQAGATRFFDARPSPVTDNYYWVVVREADGTVHESNATLPFALGSLTNLETQIVAAQNPEGEEVAAIKITWDFENFPYDSFHSIELYRNTENKIDGRSRINPSVGPAGEFIDFTANDEGQNYWYMFKIFMNTGEFDGDAPIRQRYDSDPEGQIIYSSTVPPKTNLQATLVNTSDAEENQVVGIKLSWDLQDFPEAIAGIELYRNDINQLGGRSRINRSVPETGEFIDTLETAEAENGKQYWYMFKVTLDDGQVYNTNPEAAIFYVDTLLQPEP
ncbi:MAG: rhamnogalacturonan lyase [Cellvibrionaceae bacterium]|nr:rhamnogalacturonan lyase [Cellvibrionaceae bacterium]